MPDKRKTRSDLLRENEELKRENESLKARLEINTPKFAGGIPTPNVMASDAGTSAQNKVENGLAKSQALLNETSLMAKIGGWELDAKTLLVTWTRAVYLIHEVDDLSFNPNLSKGVDFYTPESRPIIELAVKEALSFGKPFDVELEIITAKGNRRHVSAIGKANYYNKEIVSISGIFQDITDSKTVEQLRKKNLELERAKASLEESELKFRTVADYANSWEYWIDEYNKIRYISPSCEHITGYSGSAFLADEQLLQKIIHPDDCAIFTTWYNGGQPFAQENEPFELDYRIFKKDGSIAYLNHVCRPIYDTNSTYLGRRVSCKDITGRKKAEALLNQSEARFRELFDYAPVCYHELDKNGLISHVNRTELALLGYSEEEMLGHYIWEFIYDRELSRKAVSDKLDGKLSEKGSYERTFLKKDGTKMPVLIQDQLLHDQTGIITGIRTTMQDSTERKEAEEEIMKLLIALEQSPASIVITDRNGNIEYVNPKFCRITGYTKDEVFGKNPRILQSGTTRQEIYEELWTTILSGGEWHGQFQNKRKTGDLYWESVSVSPVKNAQNEITHFIGVKEDITERMLAEEEILTTNYKLKKSNSEKDKFFSIIAHDLRSPFQAFLGYTELLAVDTNQLQPEEISQIGHEVHTVAKNLYKLLGNLLEWARIQQGQIEFKPIALNLADLVCQNTESIIQNAKQKNITIKNEIPKFYTVMADEQMTGTIIRNLVSNAVKFTHRGGEISLRAESADDNMIRVTVADTGIGIPPETMVKLFKIEEKTGTKGTEGELSTGLGLLLCKEFTEKQGGEINVESAVGKGSTFSFTIPKF